MSAGSAIVLRNVTKRFGSLVAVDRLGFDVPRGVCMGLLGPNGAGKSTLMRLLIGLAVADRGTIEVLGLPLPAAARAVRARCGVVPQIDNLDNELTVEENLAVYARFQRIAHAERDGAVRRALQLARLTDRADTPADELSGGMRRRLLIARGTLHQPDLVLLDEPTVGLDPQIRFELWTQIEALKARGVTVVVSTHYMEEAERLCDLVAILHRGRLVAYDRPRALIASHVGADVIEVAGTSEMLHTLERRAHVAGLSTRRAGASIAVLGVERAVDFDAGGGARRHANLEDVFVMLTGTQLT